MVKKFVYVDDTDIMKQIVHRVGWRHWHMPAEFKLFYAIFGEPGFGLDEVYTATYLLSHQPSDDNVEAYIEEAASWVRGQLDLNLKKQAERARPNIEEVLQTLTPREARVLILRFGFDDDAPRSSDGHILGRTLEAVGREFSVNRERIRQIEAKVLRKLRHPSRSHKLKERLMFVGAILDEHVNRDDLWGLAWWADRRARGREGDLGTKIKQITNELRDRDKEIDYLNLELDRARAINKDVADKTLSDLPVLLREMSIDQLDLSVRARRLLKRGGVETVGNYLLQGEAKIARLRGVGVKALREIRTQVEKVKGGEQNVEQV